MAINHTLEPVFFNTNTNKYEDVKFSVDKEVITGRCSVEKQKRVLSFTPNQISR